jgi:hypothetical protein
LALGGYPATSPLEKHADFLLGLIAEQPDLTLDEIILATRKHKVPGSRTAMCASFSITGSRSIAASPLHPTGALHRLADLSRIAIPDQSYYVSRGGRRANDRK